MPEATGKPLSLSMPFVKAALVTGKFKTIIQLPKRLDVNEWVALNLYDFNTNLNLFLSFLPDFCTAEACPTMSIGPNISYPWVEKNGRSSQIPAPTHIDYILTWIQNVIDDQSKFPTRLSLEFPSDFPVIAKSIYRQMLHVFAHLYHAHYSIFLHSSSEAHFNSLFAHFAAFGAEFGLLEKERDLVVSGVRLEIAELIDAWKSLEIIP